MTTINAQAVKELREATGAGIMDCKKALQNNNGSFEKSVEELRKKGLSKAAKKAGRIAAEGVVASYIHTNNKIGVLLEVNCETDFVAKNEDFKNFAHDLTLHIAAMNPEYLTSDEIPASIIEKEKEIYKDQFLKAGKPENIVNAKKTLKFFSGKTHDVISSITLVYKDIETIKITGSEKSRVIFKKLTDIIIREYLNIIDYSDKAGAYAIQEHGKMIIEDVHGSVSNIIGFPLRLFFRMLNGMHILEKIL